MQAAFCLARLTEFKSFLKKCRKSLKYLQEKLGVHKKFIRPYHGAETSNQFPLTKSKEMDVSRQHLMQFFKQNKVGWWLLFVDNFTRQSAYKHVAHQVPRSLVNNDSIMKNTVWLDADSIFGVDELDYEIVNLNEFFGLNF